MFIMLNPKNMGFKCWVFAFPVFLGCFLDLFGCTYLFKLPGCDPPKYTPSIPSPETKSKFEPENGWLEDDSASFFGGPKGLF